jgi:hypothetical protein
MRKTSHWFEQLLPTAHAQAESEDITTLGQYILSVDKMVQGRMVEFGKIHDAWGSISQKKWNSFMALVPADLQKQKIRGVRLFCDTDAKNFSLDSAAYRRRKSDLCLNSVPGLPAHRAIIFFEDGSYVERRSVPERGQGLCTASEDGRSKPKYRHFFADYRISKGKGHMWVARDFDTDYPDSVLVHCCKQSPNCLEVVSDYIRKEAPAAYKDSAEPRGRDRGLKSVK